MSSTLIIPETIVHDTVVKIFRFIENNYTDNLATPSKSFLHRLVKSLSLQKYDFYDQGKAVFVKLQDDSRKVRVNMFFNAEKANIPSVHIMYLGDTSMEDGINLNEGFRDSEIDSDPSISQIETIYRNTYTRRSKGKINIVITSDNTNEVILMYHLLTSLLESTIIHMNMCGLENIIISGGDIHLNEEIVPKNVYARNIQLTFEFEKAAISIIQEKGINFIKFLNAPVSNIGTPPPQGTVTTPITIDTFLVAKKTLINCSSIGTTILDWVNNSDASNTLLMAVRVEYNSGTFDDSCRAEIALDTDANLVLFQTLDLLSSFDVTTKINAQAIQNFTKKTGDLQFKITSPSGNSGCFADVYIYGLKVL